MNALVDSSFGFTVRCRERASFIFEPDALEFEDRDAAREHALAIIEEIVGQDFLTPHDWRSWDIEVTGADGWRLVVPFTEACGASVTAQLFRLGAVPPSSG